MRLGLFGKGSADKGSADKGAAGKAQAQERAGRIKALMREILGLSDAAAIAVNEIICADPACPGTETVILVMNPGEKTKAFKLQMAMSDVTPEAVQEMLAVEGL